ncbi:diacylglycerol/lipid kinase family protein [Pollutibacter soli]|uniref:diacylglycerol/lipid kinase family protein n=1 Tax=Pollutibacter soli TaxID=3034157 RepID=UPI003013985E
MPARWYVFYSVAYMKEINRVQLLHNPGAGSESISREELSAIFKTTGWEFEYASTKDHWGIDPEADLVVVAGGDGTVKKISVAAMEATINPLIGVLPMGTANNLATSLGIPQDIKRIISSWKEGKAKAIAFDTGVINNPVISDFFIEGVGFGIFPKMINDMKKKFPNGSSSPEDNLQNSLEAMYEATKDFVASHCEINIDGRDYSGEMLLVEIMNIRCVGPNVFFAPHAHPGDGRFDIVLGGASDRSRLKKYFIRKINQDLDENPLPVIHGKNIKLTWNGPDFHLDDTIIDISAASEISISINKHQLHFLVPEAF